MIEFCSDKAPIRQFGQRIEVCQLLDGLSLVLLLGDISNNGNESGLVAFKFYILEENLYWDIRAVFPPVNSLKIESWYLSLDQRPNQLSELGFIITWLDVVRVHSQQFSF